MTASISLALDASTPGIISIIGGPGGARDWVAIFPAGAPNKPSPAGWRYLANDSQTKPLTGVTSGTVHLAIPTKPGAYEIRFLSATGAADYRDLATAAFTIATAPPPPPPPPPPPGATPKTLTLIPASVSVPSTAFAGAIVGDTIVTMSSDAAFTGSLSAAPAGMIGISGKNLVLTRGLTAADVGNYQFQITASQNGASASATLTLEVKAVVVEPPPPLPPPGAADIVLSASVARPSTADYPLSSFNVTVTNGPGKAGDRVVICDALGNETARQAVLSAGQSNAAVTLWAPQAAGEWTVRFMSAAGALLASKPLRTATLTKAQLFPILTAGSWDNSKVIISLASPTPKPSWQQIVTGAITFGVSWFSNGGLSPPDGTVTMQWTVDGVPVSPYVVGPPFSSFALDTTTLADGSHAVSILFIDSTNADFNRPSLAYQLRPVPLIIIVANKGFNNGTQLVPSTDRAFSAGGIRSSGIEWVKYPGNAALLQNPVYPYPVSQFIPGSSDPSLRNISNWCLGGIDRTVNQEYETIPRFCTTPKGGVFVGPLAALRTNEIAGSYDTVERNCSTIGGRNNGMSDAYSNFVEASDGSGMVGVDLSGRVYKIAWDGAITIVVGRYGNRSVLPADFQDATWDDDALEDCYTVYADVEAGFDSDLAGANDLCYDPRNPKLLYVAQTLDHCIYKADLSVSPPRVTRFAGQLETPGFADGDARTTALFNAPYSICMTNNGTMYVADRWNHRIRTISPDGKTVSTLFGKQDATLPTKAQFLASEFYPETATTGSPPTTNYDRWCPDTVTSFADSYALAPQVIKVTSTGNLVLGESWSMAFRFIDLTAKTTKRIGIFGAKPHTRLNYSDQKIHANGEAWFWGDINSGGKCGPVDDIVFFHIDSGDVGAAAVMWRISIDGNYSGIFGGDTGYSPTESFGGGGHYPWVLVFSRTQGRILSTGAANFGMFGWRIRQPGDPVMDLANNVGIDGPAFRRGKEIYFTGSCRNFPWGCRPGFGQLRGPAGGSMLGLPETEPFDTLMAKYPDDASLGAYIQSGFGGAHPRPELTGDDLADLIYFIRRTSLPGSFPVPLATRAPFAVDVTPPVISNVAAVRLSSPNTRIKVTWTTDKPTYGFVAAGSPSSAGTAAPYNRDQLESWGGSVSASYRTSHSVIIDSLPTATPTHLVVLSKDVAGNSTTSADLSIP